MSVVNPMPTMLMDEPKLTENARRVLEARYLKKNESGDCTETPRDLFHRVARTIADVEREYGTPDPERQRWEKRFYDLMATGRFMPNSPTLMNAGREMGMLSACFVLPVRDSIVDIFDGIKHTAMIQKAGGGTGFAFDELRPTGDYIKSSGGTTSGPISFWRAFSEATNAIQQGAFRRGANMGMMYIHHPDILKFLHAKQDLNQFTNYNISVKVTDTWMNELLEDADSPHVVRNPRSGKAYVIPRDVEIWKYEIRDLIEIHGVELVDTNSRATYYTTPKLTAPVAEELREKVYTKGEIWGIIVQNAWQTGEPGVVFIDRINQHNPTPALGRIEATNPCGEQPLLPYEACNLGSVNLGAFVRREDDGTSVVDWDGLRETIHVATRFLDNVIDANNYPLPEIEQICRSNRKIGLGVMGFADALYKLGVAYNSEDGVAWARRFMRFLNDEAHNYSELLARERGCFLNWQGSIWHTKHNRVMRNAAVTTIAPTGTISIIANCSGGIEPLFSLAFLRNVLRGQKHGETPMIEVNETFRAIAEQHGILTDALLEQLIQDGTLAHANCVPDTLKRVFVCAHDITPEWHMRMQAAFQEHCDASISKTINFPEEATREHVEQIYRFAFELGCKGVTVYRNNCRAMQPMALKNKQGNKTNDTPTDTTAEPATRASEGASQETIGAVQDPPAVPTSAAGGPPASPPRVEPMDLPEIVSGFRIRQMTPFGNMHVKITVDPRTDRELEIFAQLGKGGDVANSDLEGLCRTASLWLRAGGNLRLLIKQWEGIGSSMQIPTRGGRIMSLPDGLACALKKYLRAKERFGLKALLLGEITPNEIDNPNPAPHTPERTPIDRPAKPNGGKTGNGGSSTTATATPTVIERRADASIVLPPKSPPSPDSGATPQAVQAARTNGNGHGKLVHGGSNGNGNGKYNGHGHGPITKPATEPNVAAVAELESEPGVETAVVDVAVATEPTSATHAEPQVTSRLDLASVLSTVQHRHDSASHYKLMCPECGQPLMIQEGCRKCASCGWAAC